MEYKPLSEILPQWETVEGHEGLASEFKHLEKEQQEIYLDCFCSAFCLEREDIAGIQRSFSYFQMPNSIKSEILRLTFHDKGVQAKISHWIREGFLPKELRSQNVC